MLRPYAAGWLAPGPSRLCRTPAPRHEIYRHPQRQQPRPDQRVLRIRHDGARDDVGRRHDEQQRRPWIGRHPKGPTIPPLHNVGLTPWPPLHVVERGNLFFFNDTAATEIYTLSLHDALPI